MPNWPTQFLTFMGVGTQCRRSLSPFPVGLLPPQNWVWCVWCGVFGVVCVCNWWWPTILQNVLVSPMVCWLWQKKPDAPDPRDKTRWKWKKHAICGICVLHGSNCLQPDWQCLWFEYFGHHANPQFSSHCMNQTLVSACNVEVKVVICLYKKLQILWKLGGPQSCKL